MGTRTNFSKNAAFTYDKYSGVSSALENLYCYQVATGELPLVPTKKADTRSSDKSRRHEKKRKIQHFEEHPQASSHSNASTRHVSLVNKYDSAPFDSAPKLRSAIGFEPYELFKESDQQGKRGKVEVLCNDLATNVFKGIVYAESSDEDDGAVQHCQVDLSRENDGVIVRRSDQRFAAPGEPSCAICGRYGAYICNKKEEDICSIECRDELLQKHALKSGQEIEESRNFFESLTPPNGALQLPESEPDVWDHTKNQWKARNSILSTYKCWKCGKAGHLSTECLSTKLFPAPISIKSDCYEIPINKDPKGNIINSALRSLYKKCKMIAADSLNAKCSVCRSCSNLGMCMDCNVVFCDSSGHLSGHLLTSYNHCQLYSYKLQCMVKCSKSTCNVTDIRELLCCHHCFDKAFDKYYNMYTATWNGVGLKYIRNSVCCDEHFTWHRANCPYADAEGAGLILKEKSNLTRSQFCDFLF